MALIKQYLSNLGNILFSNFCRRRHSKISLDIPNNAVSNATLFTAPRRVLHYGGFDSLVLECHSPTCKKMCRKFYNPARSIPLKMPTLAIQIAVMFENNSDECYSMPSLVQARAYPIVLSYCVSTSYCGTPNSAGAQNSRAAPKPPSSSHLNSFVQLFQNTFLKLHRDTH